jgi:phosphoglycolate phosphatase
MHLLFDLDGTVTDSFVAIRVTVEQTLLDLGAEPTTDVHLRSLVGAPLDAVFRRVLGASRPDLVEPAVARYRVLFDEIGMPHVRLFPAMHDTLGQLKDRGHVMHLVTARGAPSAGLIARQLGLDRFFGRIYAPDRTHENFDKADFVRLAMTESDATPEATVMVGDRADDVRAGRAHGAFTIGVAWGNGSRAELEAAGAHTVVERVQDLGGVIASMPEACR